MNSSKGVIDVELLRYYRYVSVLVPGCAAKRQCVLPIVLDSGSSVSLIRKRGLRRMQQTWPDVQVEFPYESKLVMAMADG